MKPFEFVLVVVSIIFGLALSEAVVGVSVMIQTYRTAHFYLPHIVLTLTGILMMLNHWVAVYKLKNRPTWTVAGIGVVFLPSLFFFILTQIYFPDPNDFDQDYEHYFNENINIIWAISICYLLSVIVESFLLRKVKFKIYLAIGIYILLLFSGILLNNSTYNTVLAYLFMVMQVYNIYSNKLIIGETV